MATHAQHVADERKRTVFFKPFDAFYINPTTRHYHEVIQAQADLTVALHNLSRVGENLAADIVIFTPFVFLGKTREAFEQVLTRLRNNYDVPELRSITFDQCQRYLEVFLETRSRSRATIALMTEYDLHAINGEDMVIATGTRDTDYFLLPGLELYDFERHKENSEGHSSNDISSPAVMHGADFISARRSRIISLPHMLSPQEFCLPASIIQGRRSRRMNVPGMTYVMRAGALQILRGYPSEYAYALLERLAYRSRKLIWSSGLRRRFLWESFRRSITSSRISFTCGSTSGYFVRKFLEIPALGACLCTFEYSFLPRIGLLPHLHFLPVKSVQEISDYIERQSDSCFMEQVIDCTLRAHSFIFRNHSTLARFAQFGETLDRICRGAFAGSYWENGAYRFHESAS